MVLGDGATMHDTTQELAEGRPLVCLSISNYFVARNNEWPALRAAEGRRRRRESQGKIAQSQNRTNAKEARTTLAKVKDH